MDTPLETHTDTHINTPSLMGLLKWKGHSAFKMSHEDSFALHSLPHLVWRVREEREIDNSKRSNLSHTVVLQYTSQKKHVGISFSWIYTIPLYLRGESKTICVLCSLSS